MNLLSGSANVTTTPAAATTPNNNNINNNHNQHHSSNGGSLVGVNRSGVVSLNATNFIGGVSNSSTGSSLSLLNSANANLTAASMSGSQSIPVIRAPTLRRGRHDAASTPLSQRIDLERVLGLTVSSSAAVAVDPLTATVAYPAGCVVILYNTKTNRQSHIVSPSKKTITSLAFSWDGRFLATGECGHQPQLRVWDVERRQQLAEFPGHKYGINCVAFSPNLKYVVSVGSQHDSVVNVWDWRSDTKVASNKVSAKVSRVIISLLAFKRLLFYIHLFYNRLLFFAICFA